MSLNRPFGVACLIVCFGFSLARPWRRQADPKVTITLPAMSVSNVLKELSAKTGLSLTDSPQTVGDVVTLRFKDVPISEALARIAEAVDGTWRTEGEVNRLIRTSDQVRAEKSHEFSQDVERFRRSIENLTSNLKKLSPWSSSQAETLATEAEALTREYNPTKRFNTWYQRASAITHQTPMSRIMGQLAAMLDPKELASLPSSYKTVWSSNPTSMQRPMSHEMISALEQGWRDQAEWAAVVARHDLTNPEKNLGQFWLGDQMRNGDQSAGSVATVLVTASSWGPMSGITLSLTGYDASGKRVSQSQISLGGEYRDLDNVVKLDAPRNGEKTINLDGDARRLMDTISQFGGHSQSLPNDLKERLLQPDQFEPLAFLASPPLIQAAEIKNINMVACLSEKSMDGAMSGPGTDLPVNRFLERLPMFQESVELREGWLIVKPTRANENRVNRVNRQILGRYLQRLSSGGPLSLDESADFALKLPDRQLNDLPVKITNYLRLPEETIYNREMLRLYALFTPDQKHKMTEGGLPFSSLTEAEMSYVDRMIYGTNSTLQFGPTASKPGFRNIQIADWNLYLNGILSESTESLPNGIPSDGVVIMNSASSLVVAPTAGDTPGASGLNQMMSPQTLAWQKFAQERPDLFPWMNQPGQKLDLGSMQFGQQTQLVFRFELTNELSMSQSLQGRGSTTFQKTTLDSLPDDFKKQFDQAYQNYKKAYANASVGRNNSRGQAPPP